MTHAKHLLILSLSVALVACTRATPPTPPPPTPTGDAVCLQGDPFVDDGPFPLEDTAAAGDAAAVGDLRWAAHDGCERLVIDFADKAGAPAASVGQAQAEVLRSIGVVRVTLPEVASVDPENTDAEFDGPLAHAAYVVRAAGGRGLYVDLHLGSESQVHVEVLSDPARVAVDLRPGGGPIPEAAATGNFVVVATPRPGGETYPLTVTGYARTFEANVVVRIVQDDRQVFDDFTTATDYTETWGHFSLVVSDGPSGTIELHVGEYSAEDGTWQGALVRLTMQ